VSVGPLLIASFVFNFNNFAVIYPFLEGKPPMAGTTTPAGHTDILISYTYRIAFEGGRGADYAYAAAITIVIFIIVAVLTLIQYQFTRRWEEVSESV
jgi:ABC-type sugar transport system permease subunit